MLFKKVFLSYTLILNKRKEVRMFTKSELKNVEKYFQNKVSNPSLTLKEGNGKDAPAEVLLNGEFIGVVYKDEDEGEISFDFNMSILNEDL